VAATTAGNVVAQAGLLRLGVVADLCPATIWVFVALTRCRLLQQDDSPARWASW
jgi:hypothetical protein